ncbi:MAG: response regulator transcription factor [Acidobacteria bacterium]|nr:response regulator transcription factor [Acidobacteriota bacterium]
MSTCTPIQGLSRRVLIPSVRTVSTVLDPESQSLFINLRSGRYRAFPVEPSPAQSLDFAVFGEVHVDFLRHEIWRAGEMIAMTAFEFRVLRFFVANPGRVISRDELLQTVWGYNCYPTTRTVDNKILRLRQKLEPDPARPVHFLTIHGAGYKFVP